MILAIDQGTTGTTCLVFDERAEPIGRAYREFAQHFPRPGWVEHDPREIWEVTRAVAGEALQDAGVRPGDLDALGITNQRETVCVWDPDSGEPLHHAIVWQDRRTAARCEELRSDGPRAARARAHRARARPLLLGHEDRSGCSSTSTVCASAPSDGRAVFGTVDSWLIFKLTGEHLTDATNASRTLLYDIAAGRWDPELLELFGIPERALPRGAARAPAPSARPGRARSHGHAVPRRGVAGDQQAALFGQACVDPGMGKNTYGTGSFVLVNAGFTAPEPPPRPARDRRLADRRSARLRAGGLDLRHRRRRAVAARRPRHHRARRARPSRSPRRSTPTTASTSCPR